jgi:hypothetical protein
MDSNQLKPGSVWFLLEPQNDITEKEWTEICEWIERDLHLPQVPQWLKKDLSLAETFQLAKGDLPWEQTHLLVDNINGLSEPVWRHFRLPQPGEVFNPPL